MDKKEWLRERKFLMVNLHIAAFTFGLVLTAYYPTEFFYIRDVVKVDNPDFYFGLARAFLYGAGIIATFISSFYADKTKNIRGVFLITDVLCIVGNILYVFHYHIVFILIGQLFAGTAGARIVTGFGEIARVFEEKDLNKQVSIVSVVWTLGLILGPCTVYAFDYVDFHIYTLEISIANSIGLLMAFLFVFQLFLNYFTLKNVSLSYTLKGKNVKYFSENNPSKDLESTEKIQEEKDKEGKCIEENENVVAYNNPAYQKSEQTQFRETEESKENEPKKDEECLKSKVNETDEEYKDIEMDTMNRNNNKNVTNINNNSNEVNKVTLGNDNKEADDNTKLPTSEKINQPSTDVETNDNFFRQYFKTLALLFRNKYIVYLLVMSFFATYLRASIAIIEPIKADEYYKWDQKDIAVFTIIIEICGAIPVAVVFLIFAKRMNDNLAFIFTGVTLLLALIALGIIPYLENDSTAGQAMLYSAGLLRAASASGSHILMRTMMAKAVPENIQTIADAIRNTFFELGYVASGLFTTLPANYLFEFMMVSSGIVVIAFAWFIWRQKAFKNLKL